MSDNSFIHKEAFNLLCDERIGYGMSRSVFSSKILFGAVVKVEEGAQKFQNILEWEAWQRIAGTKWAKWFAPCRAISPCGSVLVMERTTPAVKFPDKMPVFLTDFKRTNYGMLHGRFVCHDYGTSLLMENGMTDRMRKANWWDE